MAHWETATRALHRHGGGPLGRSAFDGEFETDLAAIAGIQRARKLGLVAVAGVNFMARWTLTQRGVDWCNGLVRIVGRVWQRVRETTDERQKRVARLVSDSAEAFEVCAMLTRRQREVLVLIAKGFTRREIATRLDIKPDSVMNCTGRILLAIGCTRHIEAAVIAAKAGIV